MRPSIAILGTRGYPSYYGGFETAVRHLAPFLADAGWDVTVYSRPGNVRLEDPERDARVKTIMTGGVDRLSLSTLTFGFTAALRALKTKPDVVLAMNVANGLWVPFLRMAGIPTVVNVDGVEWHREKWNWFAKAVFRIGASLTARFASEIVVDAKAIGEFWQEEFHRAGEFIPYGADFDLDRSQDGLPFSSGSYGLLVARFVPENTVPEFLQAVRMLAPDRRFVLVGSTGYSGRLDAEASSIAEEFENVVWMGKLSDDALLKRLWQNCGVYFHGHSVGGTNPALVQAMACGAPIVARDTVFTREVLGPEARFVDPIPTDIAETICSVLDNRDEAVAMGQRSRDRAMELYTWPAVSSAYEALLKELVAGGPVSIRVGSSSREEA